MEGNYKYFWDDNGNLARFRVEVDDMDEGPREWDNVGKMYCWHRDYRLGDDTENNFRDEGEFLEEMYLNYVDGNADVEEIHPMEMLRCISDGVVMLPLYLLDHSGLSMSTTDFCDRWDSGRVGWIWCDKATAMKELNATEENWREETERILKGEVRDYDMYLQNEVYWYSVETARKGKWLDTGEEFFGGWDYVDSCGGFYSEKYGEDLIRELASEAGLNPDGFYDSETEALAAHAMPLKVKEIA